MFLALKTEDGSIKGKISFYCNVLGITRQGFHHYLKTKNLPWKYQSLAVRTVFESKSQFTDILNRSIAEVMNQIGSDEVEQIDKKLEQLQKELLKLANGNKDYSVLADEIYKLRDEKEAALAKNAGFASRKQQMAEISKGTADGTAGI